jgi:NAD(P)-dependent dehydrogenase (short-subunit alcohol dehydrogenase family)
MPTVVITGASGGLGAALALALAKKPDYKLVLLARSADKLETVAAQCGGASKVIAIKADVTSRADVKKAVEAAVKTFGTIDVWVNNAGRGCFVKPSEVTEEVMADMMNVNVLSAMYGMQKALPIFKAQKRGRFVNISSLLGRSAGLAPMFSAYSAAKYMLNGITDALRAEVQEEFPEIHFTTVSPGGIATDFGAAANGPSMVDLPGTQSVVDAAQAIIVGAFEKGEQEVYTHESHKGLMRAHLQSLVPADEAVGAAKPARAWSLKGLGRRSSAKA